MMKLFFLLCCIFPGALCAQYRLPTADILKARGVREITVTKTALRHVNMKDQDVSPVDLDRHPHGVARYYLNDWGLIDSIHHYPDAPKGYWTKIIYVYDSLHRPIEAKVVSADGEVTSRQHVEWIDGGWYYRSWNRSLLELEIRSTADSIQLTKTHHTSLQPQQVYIEITYDLELDLLAETWWQGDIIRRRDTKQWISENDQPKAFVYTTMERDERGKVKEERYELVVDSTGMVINKLNGLLFDPFRTDNYFTRHERFIGIRLAQADLFKLPEWVTEQASTEPLTFDGVSVVYLYEFHYR
jgi:hypothetical protein